MKWVEFRDAVENNGLTAIKVSGDRWQGIGGVRIIDYFKLTDTLMAGGVIVEGDIYDAIEACGVGDGGLAVRDPIPFFDKSKRCFWCDKPLNFGMAVLDHKVPPIVGGLRGVNINVISCRSCRSRRDRG
jgi:hypothetical protein